MDDADTGDRTVDALLEGDRAGGVGLHAAPGLAGIITVGDRWSDAPTSASENANRPWGASTFPPPGPPRTHSGSPFRSSSLPEARRSKEVPPAPLGPPTAGPGPAPALAPLPTALPAVVLLVITKPAERRDGDRRDRGAPSRLLVGSPPTFTTDTVLRSRAAVGDARECRVDVRPEDAVATSKRGRLRSPGLGFPAPVEVTGDRAASRADDPEDLRCRSDPKATAPVYGFTMEGPKPTPLLPPDAPTPVWYRLPNWPPKPAPLAAPGATNSDPASRALTTASPGAPPPPPSRPPGKEGAAVPCPTPGRVGLAPT